MVFQVVTVRCLLTKMDGTSEGHQEMTNFSLVSVGHCWSGIYLDIHQWLGGQSMASRWQNRLDRQIATTA